MKLQRVAVLVSLGTLTIALVAAAFFALLNPSLGQTTVSAEPFTVDSAPQALRLTVPSTGLFAISYRDLSRWNLPVSELSVDAVRLARDGKPVPFFVRGEGEDAFLYFFAEAATEASTEAPVVYWLSPGHGLSMPARNGRPQQADATLQQATGARQSEGHSHGWQRQRWEENVSFQPTATGADRWLGRPIYAPGSLEIPLTGIWPTTGPGELTLQVWSGNQSSAYPDHHLEVWLNGYKLGSHLWDGRRQETITISVTSGILREANNVLSLQVPGDTGAAGEAIYVDWITLAYEGLLDLRWGQLLFNSRQATVEVQGTKEETFLLDITDPQAPILLEGAAAAESGLRFNNPEAGSRFLVANPEQARRPEIAAVPEWQNPLKQTTRGADYIAIVPGEPFSDTLSPLLAYRQAQGLRVAVVPLEQIYAEFAFGRPTPAAIRDFLQYAHGNWQPPAPRFALLVGDASSQAPGSRSSQADLLPAYLAPTDLGGAVASDTWFVLFEEDSLEPAMAIGRLPVQTIGQLQTIVEKTLAYEGAGTAPWLDRVLLVADDQEEFNLISERLAEKLVQSGYQPHKLYMTESEDVRDAIISALNHGVGLVNYVGHGSVYMWGDEMVLQADDTSMLMNGQRLPVFTTFTCLNGFFNHPEQEALAEAMLWAANGGIVAAVAPSGRTYSWQQGPLAATFYDALLNEESATLGEILRQTKIAVARDPHLREAIHTFNLLGDPALTFQMPGPE